MSGHARWITAQGRPIRQVPPLMLFWQDMITNCAQCALVCTLTFGGLVFVMLWTGLCTAGLSAEDRVGW